MVTRKEIRGELKGFCEELPQDFCPYKENYPCNTNDDCEECEDCRVTFLLKLLHSQGVVIKVNTAEPPIFFDRSITVGSGQLERIIKKVRDAYSGYTCVESLIKEGENA